MMESNNNNNNNNMGTWSIIQIQSSDAYEIAQALIDKEVTLAQLNSSNVFANKAALTEEAVWNICKSKAMYQRYLDIYPNGTHKNDLEEFMWSAAIERNDMNSFMEYMNRYPQGTHVDEVDDCVWNVAKANGNYQAYIHFFPSGKHSNEARERIVVQEEEEDRWKEACAIDSAESYREYLEDYPAGRHSVEAKQRISIIMVGEKERIIRDLSEDRNAYKISYLKASGITPDDLRGKIFDSKGAVQDCVLKSWNKIPKNLQMGQTPTSIPKGSTEVYFWGVPGSGKTCAMAAILSRARQMGCFAPRLGEGLGYMNELSTMFLAERDKPAVCLPPASDVDTTQYLPLTLNEKVEGRNGKEIIKQHHLSVIEISGEIFECFSREAEGKPLKSEEHRKTYEQLKAYLRSDDNPKYHFFILDSKPIRDTDQMLYLQNAAMFFVAKGIFNKTTQGISLIVTKCDVLSPNQDEWVRCAVETANTYFNALVTQLKLIMGDPREGGLGLSDGTLKVIPLSIGEVFFQSLCLFDPRTATVLVDLLMEYSKVAETKDWKKRIKKVFSEDS